MKLLSVVIPIKNEKENLIKLCKSIAIQCCKEAFEVIIIDDSEPEYENYVGECIDILKSAKVNVRHFRGEGKGVGTAMFKGLLGAEGVYIIFLDADNILRENFMSRVRPLLTDGLFISFFSKGIILKQSKGLYYANQFVAALRKGLFFNRRYGFINNLYIWHRELILTFSELKNPKISLLDQIDLKKLIELHIVKIKRYHSIDEILVEDHRYIYEAHDVDFIYKRLKWYWCSFNSLKEVLKFKDLKIYLLLLPVIVATMYIIGILIGIKFLIILIALYLLLLIITEKLAHKNPLAELVTGVIWLPVLLVIKGILAYIILIKLAVSKNKDH
jgi:glycosyltransferase involved in cell wall biosynthesis